MFGMKLKLSISGLGKDKKDKIVYRSDDKSTFIPNSKLQELNFAEIRAEFHKLVNEIDELCDTS